MHKRKTVPGKEVLHTSMVGSLVGSNVGTIGDAVGYRVG